MALPEDVTSFDLTFGDPVYGYTDATGITPVLVGATGKLYPIDLATGKRLNLVHVATGQTLLPADIRVVLDEGGKAKATVSDLPHTDNPSLSTVGFGYEMEWDLPSGRRHVSPGNKTFSAPASAGATVDFDLLDVAEAVPGVLVPVGVGPQGTPGPAGPQGPPGSAGSPGVDPTDVGYDIVLLMGQSNIVGYNFDADTTRFDVADPRTWAFPYSGTYARQVILATDPLGHQDGASGVGPGTPFARWYSASSPPNRKVLLVPAGSGGTAFEGADSGGGARTWNVGAPDDGNNLYLNAVQHAQDALTAAGPHARVVAVLWLQGESDAINGTSSTAYRDHLETLIAQVRADLDTPQLPFLIAGMEPSFIDSSTATAAIAAVHAGTPARVPGTYYVPGPEGFTHDNLHYTAAGQRLLGRALFQMWVDGEVAPYPPPPPSIAFTETWTGANGAPWPNTWAAPYPPNAVADIQSNTGRLRPPTGGWAGAVTYRSADVLDGELTGRIIIDSGVSFNPGYINLVMRGQADGSGYGVQISVGEGSHLVTLATTTPTRAAALGVTINAGVWYRTRIRCVGATVQVKLWVDGTAEPEAWQGTLSNIADPLGAGGVSITTQNGNDEVVSPRFDDLVLQAVS